MLISREIWNKLNSSWTILLGARLGFAHDGDSEWMFAAKIGLEAL